MSLLDTLTSPALQQKKTEIAAITLAVVNGLNSLSYQMTGWSLPTTTLDWVNSILALGLVLAFGNRMSRTETKVDQVAAKQPDSATVVLVDKQTGNTEIVK